MENNNENDVGLPNFEELDKNKDGVLSKKEYEEAEPVVEELNITSQMTSSLSWSSRHGYSLTIHNLVQYGLTEEQAIEILDEADKNTSWDDNQLDAHALLVEAATRM